MKKDFYKQKFIEQAKEIHNNYYDYSLVKYNNNKTKVKIICPEHGIFEQKPKVHLQGCGCPVCATNKRRSSLEEFVELSNEIHNNYYDYSLVDYKNTRTKVKIICPEHGIFDQKPKVHLQGCGCPVCAINKQKCSLDEFIERSNEIHNNYYDYSLVDYKNTRTKVKIVCPEHGVYKQTPTSHLQGKGCPKCNNSISLLETKWLNSLEIPIRQYKIPETNYIVDGYDPDTNTCYEFHGDFWHGNPDKYNKNDIHPIKKIPYGELYEYTILKEEHLKTMGYSIISIWETEFKNNQVKI